MVDTDEEGRPVLFAESGSTWWPLAWGPGLAAAGLLLEALTPGGITTWLWLPVAAVLTLLSATWVSARRKLRQVRLTPTTLRQGREELRVDDIAAVGDVGVSMGAVVLGGSWIVPNGADGVPLTLRDGRSVLAWARDADGLSDALRRLLASAD